MTVELLPCVECGPQSGAAASVIWLHGLGADGHDFVPIVDEMKLPGAPGVRFVFPHAPSIPVTLNGGMVMPAWYDIAETGQERRHDLQGVADSAVAIEALIEHELARGIEAERLVLAGFSQGGAMALHVGRSSRRRLAGLIGLSTYLVSDEPLNREGGLDGRPPPVFMAHGVFDPMVPLARGQACRDHLSATGYDVDWQQYPMEHEVCLEEIEALGCWLTERLGLAAA